MIIVVKDGATKEEKTYKRMHTQRFQPSANEGADATAMLSLDVMGGDGSIDSATTVGLDSSPSSLAGSGITLSFAAEGVGGN